MVFAKHIRFFSKSFLLILSLSALQMFSADGTIKLPSPYEIINGLKTKCLKFNDSLAGWAIKQEKGQSAVNLCKIIANHAGLLKMDRLPQPIKDPQIEDAALLIHKVHTNMNFARMFYALGGHGIIDLTLQVISEGCSKLDGSTVLSPKDVSESLAKCTKHIKYHIVATQLVSPQGDYRFTYDQSCNEVIDLPNPIERLKQAIKQCKNHATKNIIHERLNADLSTACDVQQEQINNKNITINSLNEQHSQLNKQIEALEKEQKENTAQWQKMWYEEHEKNTQLTKENTQLSEDKLLLTSQLGKVASEKLELEKEKIRNKQLTEEERDFFKFTEQHKEKVSTQLIDRPNSTNGSSKVDTTNSETRAKSNFWSLPNLRSFLAGSFLGGIGTFSILKSGIFATFFKFAWFAV